MPSLSGGIYDFSLTAIDGTSLPLSQLRGKKLLIVVLPASRQGRDSLMLLQLDSISRKYPSQLTILGVPSFENGFTTGSLAALRQFYGSVMGPQLLLAQGVYTNKSSGSGQNTLFAWLTDKNKNGHFDEEVKGPGQKYWVNETGQLVSVLGPEIVLGDRIMQHLITP